MANEPIQTEITKMFLRQSKNLTQTVLETLIASDAPMEATHIRTTLQNLGYDLKSSNPLASIYSVLKRLREQGKVHQAVKRIDSKIPGGSIGAFGYESGYMYVYNDLPPDWEVLPLEKRAKRKKAGRKAKPKED
jgi:hypothetical protein